jgi:hypothetical protein
MRPFSGSRKKTPSDPRRQRRQLLGRFLQEEKVGPMLLDNGCYILDARAGQA